MPGLSLLCVEAAPGPWNDISAQECQCVNTAVNKMARGLINEFLHGLLELG